MLSTLIEANLESPDGSWTPVVESNWLQSKKQKTFQIAIQPLYGESDMATFGTGTTMAYTSRQYMVITLFAPTRTEVWTLFEKMKALLNNGSLVLAEAEIGDYHQVVIRRTDTTKPLTISDPNCGPGKTDERCVGYMIDITVECRWEE